jgi:hypothetical protein
LIGEVAQRDRDAVIVVSHGSTSVLLRPAGASADLSWVMALWAWLRTVPTEHPVNGTELFVDGGTAQV